jgi:hypothetical protein
MIQRHDTITADSAKQSEIELDGVLCEILGLEHFGNVSV